MENRFPKYFSVVKKGPGCENMLTDEKVQYFRFSKSKQIQRPIFEWKSYMQCERTLHGDASRSTRHKQKQNVVTRPLSTFLADLCNKLYKSDMSDKNVYDCYMSIQHNSIVILKRIIYLQNSVFQYHVFQTLRVLKTILPAGLNFAK